MSDGSKKSSTLKAALCGAACLLGMVITTTSNVEAATLRKTAAEPAATLLLPYFEQDLSRPRGPSTVFSVNNASVEAVLAHVTIWSDLSVPVLDFNIYLTGYDVQTVNLRDILVNGILPQTASDGQDPTDTISPQGPFSQDINFASCNGQLPLPTPLPAIFIQHLQTSLTGKPSLILGNLCAGRNLGDNIARGYITIDTVNNCTLRFPSDVGYFGSGGDATDQNVLWGDYFYINRLQNTAEGNPLVHIVADASDPDTTTSGKYTFYGRYVGWSAADHRHPLATSFATRYANGGELNAGSSLVVWRDSKVFQPPFTCPATPSVRPAWYKLGQEGIVIFDETEQAQVPQSSRTSPAPASSFSPFPAESQRVTVGGTDFPVPFNAGWLYLNLNTAVTPAGSVPPSDPNAAQAWVSVKMGANTSNATFTVGYDAIQLDNASHANHSTPNQ
jgi:hypothetical protein